MVKEQDDDHTKIHKVIFRVMFITTVNSVCTPTSSRINHCIIVMFTIVTTILIVLV